MWIGVLMKRYLFIAAIAVGCRSPAFAQTIFNCSSGFNASASGACSVAPTYPTPTTETTGNIGNTITVAANAPMECWYNTAVTNGYCK